MSVPTSFRTVIIRDLDGVRAGIAAPADEDRVRAAPTGAVNAAETLATHLTWHLGQIDYHRRVVTGEAGRIGALAIARLA